MHKHVIIIVNGKAGAVGVIDVALTLIGQNRGRLRHNSKWISIADPTPSATVVYLVDRMTTTGLAVISGG